MAEKNFDTDRVKRIKKGHKFTLGDEVFHTYPGMSINFLAANDTDDEDVPPLKRTLDFIRLMIVNEDRARFDALIESPDIYIEADDLLDVSTWLIEVISGRPTKSPGSSGNGSGGTSSTSKVKPSAAGGTTKK